MTPTQLINKLQELKAEAAKAVDVYRTEPPSLKNTERLLTSQDKYEKTFHSAVPRLIAALQAGDIDQYAFLVSMGCYWYECLVCGAASYGAHETPAYRVHPLANKPKHTPDCGVGLHVSEAEKVLS